MRSETATLVEYELVLASIHNNIMHTTLVRARNNITTRTSYDTYFDVLVHIAGRMAVFHWDGATVGNVSRKRSTKFLLY